MADWQCSGVNFHSLQNPSRTSSSVKYMRSAHRRELLIYLLSMDIDLNKEESTETSEFINFSIREYVAEMRKKDPKKCWPFGSLGDPDNFEGFASYQSTKSTVLSDLNNPADINGSDDTPEHIVTPNSTKVEISNGNEDQPEPTTDMSESLGDNKITRKGINDGSSGLISSKVNNGQCQQKHTVTEGAIVGNNLAVDNDESDVDLPRRKPKKFRLVSDILKDPASELRARCDTINPENVNSRFTAEIEDESDDNLTLDRFFKKHQLKGVKVNDSTLNKKRKLIKAEGPRVDKVKRSKHESKDSVENKLSVGPGIYSKKLIGTDGIDTQPMAKCMKNTGLPSSQETNKIVEVDNIEAKETGSEDSEMAAVMLLARHFNEENPSASEQILRELKINAACACVKKKIRDHPTPFKTAAKNPVLYAEKQNKFLEEKLEEIFCSVQMNDHLKDTTASGFKSQKKFCMKKAARKARVAQNRETLVCSVNRNPADFSIPKTRNKFMRGEIITAILEIKIPIPILNLTPRWRVRRKRKRLREFGKFRSVDVDPRFLLGELEMVVRGARLYGVIMIIIRRRSPESRGSEGSAPGSRVQGAAAPGRVQGAEPWLSRAASAPGSRVQGAAAPGRVQGAEPWLSRAARINVTIREEMEPKPVVRKRPKYESEINAPKIGAKLVVAFSEENIVCGFSYTNHPRTCNLNTLPFHDSVQIHNVPENNLDVLKDPKKNLEVLKVQEKNLTEHEEIVRIRVCNVLAGDCEDKSVYLIVRIRLAFMPINGSRATTTPFILLDNDNYFVHEEDDVPYDLADSDNEFRSNDDVDDEVDIDHMSTSVARGHGGTIEKHVVRGVTSNFELKKAEEMLRLQALGTMIKEHILAQVLEGMSQLATTFLGSTSGTAFVSEDPFVSENEDPSSSENPNDRDDEDDGGDVNGGELYAWQQCCFVVMDICVVCFIIFSYVLLWISDIVVFC
uniref:Protein embryonic flower 1 isoform X1 n=1 Tax=Tanacetum cinerariifolium TaxID=118510 RepID=A0A6L2KSJ3_TANCI|nr:protein embryonic flower 1 isoform X1 [Tanacetum cinerariifolium]